jgi:hypothetical protein
MGKMTDNLFGSITPLSTNTFSRTRHMVSFFVSDPVIKILCIRLTL